jgi:hypothetical protein
VREVVDQPDRTGGGGFRPGHGRDLTADDGDRCNG